MNRLTSDTINMLRFPLAVMVVFVHSFGDARGVDLLNVDWSAFTSVDAYNCFRVLVTRVVCQAAVPTFYLMSGFLFFQKLQNWNTALWIQKCKRRVNTILFPYLLWITIAIIQSLVVVILAGGSWTEIVNWIVDNGGIRLYWDSNESSPYIFSFYFLRNLIVAICMSPITWWLLKVSRGWIVLLLTACYLFSIPLLWHGFGICYWFTIGAWMAMYNIDLVSFAQKYNKIALPLFLLLVVPSVLYKGSEGMEYPLNTLYISTLVVVFVATASRWAEQGKGKWIQALSYTSFMVYALHGFILKYFMRGFSMLNIDEGYILDTLIYLLVPLCTVASCVVTSIFLTLYLPKTAEFLGCRKSRVINGK